MAETLDSLDKLIVGLFRAGRRRPKKQGKHIFCYRIILDNIGHALTFKRSYTTWKEDSFGGLVVGILASGTRVRGFNPQACLPSEGK
jgi:hypothetical protein